MFSNWIDLVFLDYIFQNNFHEGFCTKDNMDDEGTEEEEDNEEYDELDLL